MPTPFRDRSQAGKMLADVKQLRDTECAVLIALPRGGVEVAIAVARELGRPVDVMPVEELCTPGNPEYVVGAVAENAIHVIDSEALNALGVTEDSLAIRVAEATAVVAKLSQLYRGEMGSALSVAERPVIVVDDGSATVPVLEAVALALSRRNVDSISLATPVLPDSPIHGYERLITIERDDERGEGLTAAGRWYDEHAPSDEVAGEMLRDFAQSRARSD